MAHCKDGVLLYGGLWSAREVVMRFGIIPCHKSAYDSHWRGLAGAVSSLCITKLIHRLVRVANRAPAKVSGS